jgi:hypothetical protein
LLYWYESKNTDPALGATECHYHAVDGPLILKPGDKLNEVAKRFAEQGALYAITAPQVP